MNPDTTKYTAPSPYNPLDQGTVEGQLRRIEEKLDKILEKLK